MTPAGDEIAAEMASFYLRAGSALLTYQERVLAWQIEGVDLFLTGVAMYQAAVLAAWRRAFPAAGLRGGGMAERRSQSVVIKFPDRRAAWLRTATH